MLWLVALGFARCHACKLCWFCFTSCIKKIGNECKRSRKMRELEGTYEGPNRRRGLKSSPFSQIYPRVLVTSVHARHFLENHVLPRFTKKPHCWPESTELFLPVEDFSFCLDLDLDSEETTISSSSSSSSSSSLSLNWEGVLRGDFLPLDSFDGTVEEKKLSRLLTIDPRWEDSDTKIS